MGKKHEHGPWRVVAGQASVCDECGAPWEPDAAEVAVVEAMNDKSDEELEEEVIDAMAERDAEEQAEAAWRLEREADAEREAAWRTDRLEEDAP